MIGDEASVEASRFQRRPDFADGFHAREFTGRIDMVERQRGIDLHLTTSFGSRS
jgi:hypothetical protein